MSLPSRERGLKFDFYAASEGAASVAPLAGAWVEIVSGLYGSNGGHVAPLAGAWVEIEEDCPRGIRNIVAPLAGAWVEIVQAP